MLLQAVTILNANRVAQVLYTDLVDRNISRVRTGLNVLDFSAGWRRVVGF